MKRKKGNMVQDDKTRSGWRDQQQKSRGREQQGQTTGPLSLEEGGDREMGTADGYVGRLRTVRCGSGDVWVRAESGPGGGRELRGRPPHLIPAGCPCCRAQPWNPVISWPAPALSTTGLPATTGSVRSTKQQAACYRAVGLRFLHYLAYLVYITGLLAQ